MQREDDAGENEKQGHREYPPKETLYIRNINEKVKSRGSAALIADLKYALYILFSAFGEIAEIVAKKNNRMRGQAFIVFRDVSQATRARNNLDGYQIFDKPMRIEFAAKQSKIFKFKVKE